MSRKFNFTEGELYALCLSGWETCGRHLEKMSAFTPLYTAEHIEERKAEVRETMNRYNRVQRRSELSQLRSDLNARLETGLSQWRALKHYTETAFAGEKLQALLTEAGSMHYPAARRKQWEDALQLFAAGTVFMQKYKDQLQANKNMPESFMGAYQADMDAYSLQYNRYMTAGIAAKEQTGSHTQVLNKLYDDLSRMFAAGREVFKGQKDVQDQFRFSTGLSVISGTGWAGIRGKVFDETGKMRAIPGLQILLPDTEDVVTPEEDGSFVLSHLPAGNFILQARAEGYQPWEQSIAVKTDTYSNVEVHLIKNSGAETPANDIPVEDEP